MALHWSLRAQKMRPRLRTYRDALRELLGIEFPGHDTRYLRVSAMG